MGWLSNPAPHVISLSIISAGSGTTTWTDAIRIPAGFNVFNLKWAITGGGSVTWIYSISEAFAGDYVIPSALSGVSIASSGTSITGESADGKDAASFSPLAAPYMKIGAVEKGGVTTALNAWLILAS